MYKALSDDVMTMEFKLAAMTDEEKQKLKDLFDTPEDVVRKIMDIYQYMALAACPEMSMSFGNGMEIKIQVVKNIGAAKAAGRRGKK